MNTRHSLANSHPGPACAAFEPLLPLVSHHLLAPEEARQLQAHAADCARCRARLAAYERLDDALRRHFEQVDLSPLQTEDIMSQIQEREEAGDPQAPAEMPAHAVPGIPSPAPLPRRALPPARRFVSLIAAIVPVLVIALITTALIASLHPAGKPRVPGSSPAPGQQVAPTGLYFTALTGSGPSAKPVLYALNLADGSVRWQRALPTPFDNTQPVINHGVLYFVNQDGIVVYALRTSDGKELWHRSVDHAATGLWVVNGVVYTGTAGGDVYALSASDGSVKWHVMVGDVADVAQVVGGVVYVATSHLPPGGVSNIGVSGKVYALSASDGSEKWRFALHGSGTVQVSNGLVAVLDSSSVSSTKGTVTTIQVIQWFTVLNASDGSIRWRYPGAPSALGDAFLDGDTVYVQPNGADLLQAFNASDGSLRWQKTFSGGIGFMAHPTGVLYLTADGDTIFALNSRDGSELWRRPISQLQYGVRQVDGILYGLTLTALYAVNASDGAVMWDYPLPQGAGAAIAGASNHVVYGGFFTYAGQQKRAQSSIFALDTRTGKQLWRRDFSLSVSVPILG